MHELSPEERRRISRLAFFWEKELGRDAWLAEVKKLVMPAVGQHRLSRSDVEWYADLLGVLKDLDPGGRTFFGVQES